jgi:hypothetical protein
VLCSVEGDGAGGEGGEGGEGGRGMAGGEAHLSGGCGGRDTSSFMPRSSFGHVVFAGPVRGLRSATWPHTLPIPIFSSVTAMSLRKGEVRDLISESLEILSCFYFRTSIAKSGVLTYLYGIGNLGHDYGRRAHAHEALSHPPASIHTNWIVWGGVNLQHVGMRSIVRARPLMGAVDGAAIDPSHQLVERTGTH